MIADPVSLVLDLVDRILSRVSDVKRNHEGCQFLVLRVRHAYRIFTQIEGRDFDPAVSSAIDDLQEALQEAQEAVEICCRISLPGAILRSEECALKLRTANENLGNVLFQFPLATLGLTADMQSDVAAIKAQTREAKLEDKAARVHQTRQLKDYLEQEFTRNGCEIQGVKNLIHEVLAEQSSSKRDMRNELQLFREYVQEAYKSKEKQLECEVSEIVASVVKSLDDNNKAPRLTEGIKNCLYCPISKDIMKDPVVLKDSGMTYDRSSIEEWIGQGYCHDPITKVELVCRELIPNHALQNACRTLIGQLEGSSSISDAPQEGNSRPQLMPGLFEGHGRFTIGTSFVHTLQLLFIEPNGKVLGYTLYKRENILADENMLEIGEGEWDGITKELFFKDDQYIYCGLIAMEVDLQHSTLYWSGKVSKASTQNEEHDFAITYSPPHASHSDVMHPTILQMESVTETTQSKVKYKSKIVLSLEVDSTIGGWMWFETMEKGSQLVARIVEGKWDYNATLSFLVCFPSKDALLDLNRNTTNHDSWYRITGNVNQDEVHDHFKFTAVITRARHRRVSRCVGSIRTPVDDIPLLEYPFICEASTPWCNLRPNPLRLFNMFRSVLYLVINSVQRVHKAHELRCSDYSTKANYDLCCTSYPHNLPTWQQTPLHTASWKNALNIVKELIVSGADVNVKDDNGQSPLHHATSNNSIDVLKELVKKGANADIQDKCGKIPLHIACEKNYIDIIKELIANGVNVGCHDKDGLTPLYVASRKNHINVVKELIANGATIECHDKDGLTPLHFASKKNHIAMVKELIVNDANIECKAADGCTPLHLASKNNHIDIVKELIDIGANLGCRDKNGWTPLHCASRNNHVDVVKELIAAGASIEPQTNYKRTPLHVAFENSCVHVAEELIANGANVNFQMKDGSTALHVATRDNHVSIVKILIKEHANTNLRDRCGWSPLYIATLRNHYNIVTELITNGGDVNLPTNKGWTPLCIAIQNNRIDIVEELISHGSQIDHHTNDGVCPLHIASSLGLVHIVRMLLQKGASKESRNNLGKTAYDVLCTQPYYGAFDEATIKELKSLLES